MSRLWYRNPAKEWEEALPIGNGRMGAMIFGGCQNERIQVNEESVWYGGERDRINPDAYTYLEQIRSLIYEEKITEAEELLNLAVAACPDSMHPYQTLGDIQLSFTGLSEPDTYERSLNLEDGVCQVQFTVNGIQYCRKHFMSHVDDCMVMLLTANRKGNISFIADLDRKRMFDGRGRWGEDGIYLYGDLGRGGSDYIFGIRAMIQGGSKEVIGEKLCIKNADQVLLLFCADTTWQHSMGSGQHISFDGWTENEKIEYLSQNLYHKMQKAFTYSFEQLQERHKADYGRLYSRVTFCLKNGEEADQVPTDERICMAQKGSADVGLSKLLFDYGRYLLISCSREEGLPANLQGIWNQELLPPWESKYTININTEMNYWLAESCNLSECHQPLFRLLKRMRKSGREVARRMYGCRGFVAHHNTDIHGDCAPQDTWLPSTYWVMGTAWLCTHVWMHYEYTKNLAFLEEYYPVVCEASLFYLDYLQEKEGYLVTCPSSSPENQYRLPNQQTGNVTAGATMDNQILRDLFTECLNAAKILKTSKESTNRQKELKEIGIDQEDNFLALVAQARKKLIPTRISADGTIMEWWKDYEECEPGHRHISHLYGLHPSWQITMDGTKELAKAARATLEKRLMYGGGHTGWSRAWIINFYARLWDGKRAYENLEKLLANSMYPNLLDQHPPFQIDGNFGATAAIAEMLVQSNEQRIVLLPALPEEWSSGSIQGLRVYHNAEIFLQWENKKLEKCILTAFATLDTVVYYKGEKVELHIEKDEDREVCFYGNSDRD